LGKRKLTYIVFNRHTEERVAACIESRGSGERRECESDRVTKTLRLFRQGSILAVAVAVAEVIRGDGMRGDERGEERREGCSGPH
jgi:hypothetical protein